MTYTPTLDEKFNDITYWINRTKYYCPCVEYDLDTPEMDLIILDELFNLGHVAVYSIETQRCYIFSQYIDIAFYNVKFPYKKFILISNIEQWKKIFKIILVRESWIGLRGGHYKTIFAFDCQDKVDWQDDIGLYTVKED